MNHTDWDNFRRLRISCRIVAFALTILLLGIASAQNDPAAGIQMFSTNDFGIDLATGNIHLEVPLRSKAGMSLSLASNFRAFKYTDIPGNGLTHIGIDSGLMPPFHIQEVTPNVSAAGGLGLLGATASESLAVLPCGGVLKNTQEHFGILDPMGVSHPTNLTLWASAGDGACATTGAGTATDGSGYTVSVGTGGVAIYDRSGNEVTASADGLSQLTTPDGVKMGFTTSYVNSENNLQQRTLTYTDALGGSTFPFLTGTYNGGGTSTGVTYGNDTYTFTAPDGKTEESYTVNYTQVTLRTNFQCSVGDVGPGTSYLITSIDIPGGESYQFTYEPTPGFPGDVTGRIQTITYPYGGSVSYFYSQNGDSNGMNGFDCSSTVVPKLTVTLNDNNGNSNSWTYVNNNTSQFLAPNFSVTKTDPGENQTVYQFAGEFQTEKITFQGGCSGFSGCNGGGTKVQDVTTCYNANLNNGLAGCQVPSSSNLPTIPVTQTDVYTSAGTTTQSLVETTYDTYGNITKIAKYDWGATIPPSGSPLSATTITYNGENGAACGTLSAPFMFDRPCSITTVGAAGNLVSQTNYTYNGTGHPTQTSRLVSGTTFQTSQASYNSTGTIATLTDANGAVTTPNYNGTGGCNGLLPTSVITGGLTISMQWDCNGGVATQTSDTNGQPTKYGYDSLWRVNSVTDPIGNVTNITTTSAIPATVESSLNFPMSNPTSTVDTLYTLDGLGRLANSKKRTAPNSTSFDNTIQYTYKWNSTVGTVTGPFTTQTVTGGTAVTTTQMDALGRVASVTDGGGGTLTSTYTGNDVLKTVGPSPSGEKAKSRQYEYDGLGRLISVCELTAASGSGTCSQTNAATGYWTRYKYDGLGHLLGVCENTTQPLTVDCLLNPSSGQQTRTYSYDVLGRLTSETNPESGTTTYIYDSVAANYCGNASINSSAGDLVAKADANGNHICYFYDELHRLTDVGTNVPSSTNVCRRFRYDNVSNGVVTQPSGSSITNVVGRLAEAETDNCVALLTPITDEWFSYDQDGRETDMWEMTPHSGQYYHSKAAYQGSATFNAITSLQLVSPSLYTMSWGLDGEGRPKTLTDTTSNTSLVTGATYWPSVNPAVVNLTGSDKDTYTYDSNTGRMTKYVFNVGSSSMSGTLNWNPNGTLNQLAITDGFNSGGTQTCNYNSANAANTGYDDLGRLIGFDCGTGQWGQTFSYDPFGNLTKTKMSSRNGTTWNPGYNESNNHCNGCSYDADGNVEGDGNNVYGWNVYSKLAWTATSGTPSCGTSGRCITYDAFGRAVEQSNGSTFIERWITPLGETAYMSGASSNYAYWPAPGGGTVVILGTNNYDYFHQDWMGNARITSGLSNHVAGTDQAYSPFGELYDIFGSGAGEYEMFAGLTGDFAPSTTTPVMWDTPNRELSMVGRWLSPDPAGLAAVDQTNPQSWNRYAYVLNNPLALTDPSGLYCGGGVSGNDLSNGSDAWSDSTVGFEGLALCDALETFPSYPEPVLEQTDVQTNGISGGISGANSIFTGQDFPWLESLGSQIAGLLGSIFPCSTEFGAPCNPSGPMGVIHSQGGYLVGDPGDIDCSPGMPFCSVWNPFTNMWDQYQVYQPYNVNVGMCGMPGGAMPVCDAQHLDTRSLLPTCQSMDNAGDVIGGIGEVGTIGSSGFLLYDLIKKLPPNPVTGAVALGSNILWAAGNGLNTMAKHGILCAN
jgi:YD repeat-containing protein